VDGAKCNAIVRTRCRALATIRTGGFDVAEALDPRTHTLYVAAPSGDVFVINVAHCNSLTTRGCRQRVRKVDDPRGPDGIDVDLLTNTVYVADGGQNGNGDTVSVISGSTCNASTGRGCARKPHMITVGSNAFWVTVDQATHTVYVANNNDGTVSIINGAGCNAAVTFGCGRKPRAVSTGAGVSYLAVDDSRHTLFAMNSGDDTISAINTLTCNGRSRVGCPARARNEQATFNPPQGGNPNAFALVPGTGTVYLANVGGESFLAPIGVNRCNAVHTAGCRVEAPSFQHGGAFPVLDPTTNTIYAAKADTPGIEVVNAATCNVKVRGGCRPAATIPFPDPQANLGSIDHATHTLYAADTFSDGVYAIDIGRCNAENTSGCRAASPKITVGVAPNLPVLNPTTHTLYVSAGQDQNRIYVIDASTCSAVNSSGCGQTPPTITVGTNSFVIALSVATDTIYAVPVDFPDDQVWVVNAASCNAASHFGCGNAVVAKATVGLDPFGVVVNDRTHTVYVSNNADGDLPGTVSVLDGATCNGLLTAGCSQPAPTVTVGRSPTTLALDPAADRLYVADFSSATVGVVDGARCNAAHRTGCRKPAHQQPVGSQPSFAFVDHGLATVYVLTKWPDGVRRWSVFRAAS
jgi:DNA-binding beta-propeller fold protein YncE